MAEVYVAGVGFRSTAGLRMPERTVVERGDRALAVMRLVSTELGTEMELEVKDQELEAKCMSGALDLAALRSMRVTMRDSTGRDYPRAELPNGTGFGQHEFGVFSRHIGFAPLADDVRSVVIDVGGSLGDWQVAVDVAPLPATDVARKREIDASATVAGITVRVVGLAELAHETVIELAAHAPDRIVAFIGTDMQRIGTELLVLEDRLGRRFVEEPSRETILRPGQLGWRMYAKFPRLPDDASELTLTARSVTIDDPDATVDVALPLDAPADVSFGRYRVRLGPIALVGDLLAPPGQPPGYGLRFTLAGLDETERVLRAKRIAVDGTERHLGFGWNADPALTTQSIDLSVGARPSSVQLRGAVVSVRGPWRVRFSRPS